MPTESTFTKFVMFVDVVDENVQNAQELASTWGEIENELTDLGVEVEETYAVLGAMDFLVIFEADDAERAFQASIVLERHGFDTQTMEITPTDRFAQVVEDI